MFRARRAWIAVVTFGPLGAVSKPLSGRCAAIGGDREQLRLAPDVSFRWALRFDALALGSDPLTWERRETHPILVQAIREPR